MTSSLQAFNTALASWAYWMYKGFGDFTTTGGAAEGMFNDDGTPQALKLKAITQTYAYAFQGTPEEMYFSPTSGSFYTSWIFDSSILAPTQVYMNPSIWYPNGYKWTVSKTKSGTAIPAVTVKKTEDGHDLAFNFFDTLIEDNRSMEILITQTLATLEGVIPATEEDLSIVY